MNDTLRHSQSLGKIALLCVLTLLLTRPLSAQVDFKIMVSGPWSYVTDPSQPGRIFLVAPQSGNHKVYIFPGPQAETFYTQNKWLIPLGNYDINFDSSQKMPYNYSGLEAAQVCKGSVGKKMVKAVLANTGSANYVISLPKPDTYSTYAEYPSSVEGYSESKVSLTDSSVDASVPPQLYTTWMVLHYGRDINPTSMSYLLGGNHVPVQASDSGGNPGISIVLGDPNLGDEDPHCDLPSVHSFLDRNEIWGIEGYVRFPRSTGPPPGNQLHYSYDYTCSTAMVAMRASQLKTIVHAASAGSADCHTCQMSINGAGPKTP